MSDLLKTRVVTGLAAIVSAVMLIDTTGLTFVVGWALWGCGLVVLMSAVPTGGEKPRRGRTRRYSLVP